MLTITREEEATFPAFINHKSAREWFKAKYGNRFVMQSSEVIDGEKIYFYHLVKDRDTYLEGHKKLQEGKPVYGMEFVNSHQIVEISEHGYIHVVY